MTSDEQSEANAETQDQSSAAPTTMTASARSKTPMYVAMQAARYQRQEHIRDIQKSWGRRLICYVADVSAPISRNDTLGFVDILHNVPPNGDLDLLLHTPGGDIDAAEKLITLVRARVGTGILRVIVPDFAKSAGTLIAIGADKIVMSDTSELGPIDPQIVLNDGLGNRIPQPVQSYLDAYEEYSKVLRNNPSDAVAHVMLAKFDPARIKLFEAVRERARKFAEDQLRQGMFRSQPGNYTKIAGELIDTKRWLTHGQMIGSQDASRIGLTVELLDQQSDQWQAYWKLYCLQRLALKDGMKLFESDYASLPFDG